MLLDSRSAPVSQQHHCIREFTIFCREAQDRVDPCDPDCAAAKIC